MDGYLLIDKPKGWTSFDVVAKVRGIAKQATGNKKFKVGHAGTLDPLATGLLVVLLGKATKQQDGFMKLDKSYTAEIVLGATSNTYDAEGDITNNDVKPVEQKLVEQAVNSFIGEIEQTPPIHSAIKIDGKRAYELARQGKEVELKPRKIRIQSIEITDYNWPKLNIDTHVSSGTYIRTLADDMGKALGVGGYINNLRRTTIGDFDVKDVVLIEQINPETIAGFIKPIS